MLQIGDEWKRLSKEVVLLTDRNIILYEKIELRDSLIAKMKVNINGYENVIEGYKKSEANLLMQRDNFSEEIKSLTKKIKVQKTKTFIVALVGIVGMVTLLLK